MFIVQGRTLGVLAALGATLSMVVVLDRVSNIPDSTGPSSRPALATASAAAFQATGREDGSAVSNRSMAAVATENRARISLIRKHPTSHGRGPTGVMQ